MPKYPNRLLPRKNDSVITKFNTHDILCRWSKYPLKDETGKLSALAVDERRIPEYSTNKLPPSISEDIKIAFHNNKLTYIKWKPGENAIKVKDEDFYYDDSRSMFYLKISSIDGYTSKYPYPFSEELSDYNFIFQVKVVHDPLKVNYSHCIFEISCFDTDGLSSEPSPSFRVIISL